MEISDLYGDFKGAVEVELHGFSDASLSGYGCCIYIRYCYNYGYTKSLVFSQSRAPLIKTKTIHRSELQAAFLLAKSMKNVYEILVPIMPINLSYCWSHSTIALSSIKNASKKYELCIDRHVSEICKLSNPLNWHHIICRSNPHFRIK